MNETAAQRPAPGGLRDEVMERYGVGPRYADAYLRYWESARGRRFETLAEILSRPPPEPMWFDFALSANWRGERLVERLAAVLPEQPARYLDVGCGFGGHLVAFARRGWEVTGIEIDPPRIELSRANLADRGLRDGVFARSILDPDLDRDLGTFDLITCVDVIEHVDDAALAIARMAELLRPGGLLALEIPNAEATSFVGRDGHFGLFGITLLDREDAQAYHREIFADPYDVGEYHPLSFYEECFARHGCATRVLDLQRSGGLLRPLLGGFGDYLRSTRSRLPATLRRRLQRRFAGYLLGLGWDSVRCGLSARSRVEFERRYQAEFWTLTATRSGIVPSGSGRIPA